MTYQPHSDGEHSSWRAVVGREGRYEVSSDGQVRTIKGRVLVPFKTASGYLIVAFTNPKKNFKVHRLVASAFIRPPLADEETNHLDFDKGNNHVENLEWCTNLENRLHYYKAKGYSLSVKPKRVPRGYGPNGRKLTAEQAEALRALLATGASLKQASKQFSVSKGLAWRVSTRREGYAHV